MGENTHTMERQMKYLINIPKDQKDIVVDALETYIKAIGSVAHYNDEVNGIHFDLLGLIGIFKDAEVDIRIEVGENVYNSFISRGHNVDFPLYYSA